MIIKKNMNLIHLKTTGCQIVCKKMASSSFNECKNVT